MTVLAGRCRFSTNPGEQLSALKAARWKLILVRRQFHAPRQYGSRAGQRSAADGSSSRRSHARAALQSRFTVFGERTTSQPTKHFSMKSLCSLRAETPLISGCLRISLYAPHRSEPAPRWCRKSSWRSSPRSAVASHRGRHRPDQSRRRSDTPTHSADSRCRERV